MTPRWSIVIPTYRRPRVLTLALQSLEKLQYPRDQFEVIVVNDGGESLDAVAAMFSHSLPLRIINQSNTGPGGARNHGANEGRGELLAFTDDDCTPDPCWLTRLETQLAVAPECMAGGRVVNNLTGFRNVCAEASQSLVSYLYSYYNRDPAHARFFTSNNMALRRRSFLDFGGFDEVYHRAAAEDREFCDRWIHAGRQLVYVPDAIVGHAHRLSLPAFVRQHFNYGRGALHFRLSRAMRNREPVRVEPKDFYTRLLTYPLREQRPYAPVTMALLFVTQAVNAGGYFFEKYFGATPPPARAPQLPTAASAQEHLA